MIELDSILSDGVPAGWMVKPFWALFRRVKRTGYPDAELLSVYRDHGVVPKSSRDDNFNKESEDLSGYQLVQEGALVTNKMKAWQGSIAISRYRGIVSPAYYVYEPQSREHDQFLHYLLRSEPYIALYQRISKGIRVNQWDLEHEALRGVPVPLPPLPTQKAIADFLDHETSRIDLLIEKKRRLVEVLAEARFSAISRLVTEGVGAQREMEKTTSPYIPTVPKGWRVWRLKQLARVRGGLTLGRNTKPEDQLFRTPYLRVANVQAGWVDLSDVAEIDATAPEISRYSLRAGDVLMNEGGDNDKLGRGAVWGAQIDPCLNQNHVFCVRPHDMRHSEWISLATNARYARDFFYLHSNQSTNLASISKTNLERFPIAMPQLREMQLILEVLGRTLAAYSDLAKLEGQSIDRLREFRAALITAAVTGQIDPETWSRRGTTDRRLDQIEAEMGA